MTELLQKITKLLKARAIKYLLLLIGAGMLIQLVALIGLSQSARLTDGAIQIRPQLAKLTNVAMKLAAIAPHRWPAVVIPGESKLTRVINMAEVTAQALAINPALLAELAESANPTELITDLNLTQLANLATQLRVQLTELELLAIGKADQPVIASIFGIELLPNLNAAHSALDFVIVSPELLGCTRPSSVLVLLTSPAEARSIGGLIGQYLEIGFNCGEITIGRVGANSDLVDNLVFDQHLNRYPDLYGGVNSEWVNSNLIFDVDNLTQAWARAYQAQFNIVVDFVVVVDTDLLAVLLASSGGIAAADGTELNTQLEISAYLENGVYYQFLTDQITRKSHLVQLTTDFAKSFSLKTLLQPALFPSYFEVLKQDRILVAPAVAQYLALTDQLRNIHWSDQNSTTIFIGVNNLSGSKFDFYATKSIKVEQCSADSAEISIVIQNSADPAASYPDYVNRRLDGYANFDTGVLNEILLMVPFDRVDLGVVKLPPFSASSWALGKYGYDIYQVVEFISAGERVNFKFEAALRDQLVVQSPVKIRSWGSATSQLSPKTKGLIACP